MLSIHIKTQHILCGNGHPKKLQQRKPAYERTLCQLLQLAVTLSSVNIHSPQRMWNSDSQVDINCHVKWSNHSTPSPLQWSYIGNSLTGVSYCSPQQAGIISQDQNLQRQVYREIRWKMLFLVMKLVHVTSSKHIFIWQILLRFFFLVITTVCRVRHHCQMVYVEALIVFSIFKSILQ